MLQEQSPRKKHIHQEVKREQQSSCTISGALYKAHIVLLRSMLKTCFFPSLWGSRQHWRSSWPEASLVTDTAAMSSKLATLTLGCHQDFVSLACLHLSHPHPWGLFPASAPLTPPFCIERSTMVPTPQGYFLHLTSFVVIPPPMLFCEIYRNDGADQLQQIFWEPWNKCMWPVGLFH